MNGATPPLNHERVHCGSPTRAPPGCVVRATVTSVNYKGCPRRNVPDFGRVFLMLKYTSITQNTYVQSWTVTEIMAREKCGLLTGLRTVPCQLTTFRVSALDCRVRLQKYRWRSYVSTPLWLTLHVMYSAWNPKDKYDMRASFFVVQFNGFMSLTS